MARLHSAKKAAVVSTSEKKQEKQAVTEKSNVSKTGRKQKDAKAKGKAPAKPSEGTDKFKEDVLALGGDDEDYKLLKDLDSEGEQPGQSGSNKQDAKLSKDLAKFMKSLDFTSAKPQEPVEKDEDDEQDEDEEEEESEADEGGEAFDVSKETKQDAPKQNISVPKVGKGARLLVEPTPQWYTSLSPFPGTSKPPPPSASALATLQTKAASLHTTELSAYEHATSANKLAASSSDAAFLTRVLTGGTLADRLSALTLMAQSSPVHNTRALETLKGMAQKKGREESLKALRAIVDWWVGGAAPDRKLKYFIDQPLTQPGVTDKHLLIWFFEDWLKKYFYSILQILEALSLDPLPYVRTQAMTLIYTLLCEKPEQEQNLLRLLVNKLGDSERPVASRSSYYLLRLLQAHPQMKAVILHEISALILRPRTGATLASTTQSGATHLKFGGGGGSSSKPVASTPKGKGKGKGKVHVHDKDKDGTKKDLQQEHARYYAAITLNQVMLAPTDADRDVAVHLVGLYFELFKEVLGSAGAADAGAVAPEDMGGEDVDHTRFGKEKRKRMEEKGGKGKGKGREEGESGFAEVEDSDSRLISAVLTGVNRALPFAKLGPDNVEFSKHIDTLFLICHKSTFNISLQSLRLILQISQSLTTASTSDATRSLSTSISDRYYRTLYASLFDNRLDTSSKQAMYLNLLLKSMKTDTKKERVQAFIRRFVQVLVSAGNGGVEFVAGGLYLLGEIFTADLSLRDLLDTSPKRLSTVDGEYDPRKRDPQYAHAAASPMWELTPLLAHFHPTVRLHASQLLLGAQLTAHADLALNTLAHFLDRFVYRNAKVPRVRGASAMQPAAVPADGTGSRGVRAARAGVVDDVIVNDAAFWKRDVRNVPVDQVFFHKYFSQKSEKERARAEKVSKRKGGVGDSDEEEFDGGDDDAEDGEAASEAGAKAAASSAEEDEDAESADEEEIWNAIKATHPDLRGDAEDPSDSELSLSEGSDDEDEDGNLSGPDNEVDSARGKDEDEDAANDSDALSLAERSSAASLVALSDVELPAGLLAYDSDASSANASDADGGEGEEWGGFDGGGAKRKRKAGKAGAKEKKSTKKRRLRALPTFATYEDYAALIEGEPEDNI